MKTLIASRETAPNFVDMVERVEVVRTPNCTSGSGAMASDRATVREVFWVVSLGWRNSAVRPGFGARVRRFSSRTAAMAHFNGTVS